MSKASELAELASSINVTPRGGEEGANTVAVDSFSVKKLTITDGRTGNGTFDGGNTAYPAIELLSSGMNSTTNKYTPSIKFGSTDAQFITQNPKFGAAIVAEATQNYTTDTTGGMALSFWTSPNSPGAETSLRERLTIESSGQVTVNNAGFLVWTNSQLLFTTTGQGQGARIGKWTDDNLYIENFDDADILFRNQAASAGEMMRMHGANGNVSVFNSLTIETDVYVERDLYFDSGYGSTAKAYGCRVWVNFNGVGTVSIFESGGITSITDIGVGIYQLNFSITMPDTNYAFSGTAAAVSGVSYASFISQMFPVTKTTNSLQIQAPRLNGATLQSPYDSPEIHCIVVR